jgi:hypothetical protein
MIVTTALWESVWERLHEKFQDLADRVHVAYPDQKWGAGHFASDFFPLSVFGSFLREHTEDEDVVISVQFHISGPNLEMHADVAYDRGLILADGPEAVVPLATEPSVLRSAVFQFVERVEGFLDDNLGLILRELEPPRGE